MVIDFKLFLRNKKWQSNLPLFIRNKHDFLVLEPGKLLFCSSFCHLRIPCWGFIIWIASIVMLQGELLSSAHRPLYVCLDIYPALSRIAGLEHKCIHLGATQCSFCCCWTVLNCWFYFSVLLFKYTFNQTVKTVEDSILHSNLVHFIKGEGEQCSRGGLWYEN